MLVASLLVACQPGAESTPAADAALADDDQKTAYALGFGLGRNLVALELSEPEVRALTAGIADAAARKTPRVDLATYEARVQQLAATRAGRVAQERRAAEAAFLAEAGKQEGAEAFDSGLILIHENPGDGKAPAATDRVVVHYHGTLADGSVFDSSMQRGQPATFPLNGVIPCWTEAIQEMQVGGRARIYCPPDIGYGDRGAPPRIPPGAVLVFQVELIGIVDPQPAG